MAAKLDGIAARYDLNLPKYSRWGRQMAAKCGVKGRQRGVKGRQCGVKGRQGGVTGGVTFQRGGRHQNLRALSPHWTLSPRSVRQSALNDPERRIRSEMSIPLLWNLRCLLPNNHNRPFRGTPAEHSDGLQQHTEGPQGSSGGRLWCGAVLVCQLIDALLCNPPIKIMIAFVLPNQLDPPIHVVPHTSMVDPIYAALILCIILSNLGRIQAIVIWIYEYLSCPREPQLVPYFDANGQLIGMVRLRSDARTRRQLQSRERAPPEVQAESRDVSPEVPEVRRPKNPTRAPLQPTVASDSEVPPEIPFSWDFWSDGRFQSLVSTTEVADTYKLATNWILETVVSRGSPGALTWQKGHELRRRFSARVLETYPNKGIISSAFGTLPGELEPSEARARVSKKQCLGKIISWTVIFTRRTRAERSSGEGTHNHLTFTHSSQQQRNGSLQFVRYEPKYTMKLVDDAELLDDAYSDPSEQGSDHEPVDRWRGKQQESDDFGEDDLDDEEKWEMAMDSDADQDEGEDQDEAEEDELESE
ncbi:hypothetical protein DFH06DRAFT_1123381 [Mycena polygramma]|nr:hypothetical protein DFH06DRAFT_1123381 [Mycena polygramma]